VGDVQLDIVVIERTARRASGEAHRFGFSLAWQAARDGDWRVEVRQGHSLGPEGKGAFEVVTNDDWPAFTAAVARTLQGER